jgi:thiamine pyrophosphokinase
VTYTLVVGAAPASGHANFYARLLGDASCVVAADAAGEWCVAAGRVPDMVIGDFDSSEAGAAQRLSALGVEVVTCSAAKDETDLELAVDIARTRNEGPLVLTAAFSRRTDHTLAAFAALARAGAGACAREPGWSAWTCAPGRDLRIDVVEGATLSVLSLGDATGVTLSGTVWPLHDESLGALSGRGVSNRALGGIVTASTRNGTLVVILFAEA